MPLLLDGVAFGGTSTVAFALLLVFFVLHQELDLLAKRLEALEGLFSKDVL